MKGNDCEIYHEEATGLFHMLKGDIIQNEGKVRMARLVSRDLREWKLVPEPFMEVDMKYPVLICPHLFGWNGWFYYFGGNIFVRELVQAADGTLGSKFVPEMIPPAGRPLASSLHKEAAAPGVKLEGGSVSLTAGGDPACAWVAGVPQDVRITMEVVPGSGKGIFGVGLRGRADLKDSCRLELDSSKQLVAYSQMTDSAGRRLPGPRSEEFDLPAQPFKLDIICRHDLVDVEVDGRRTLGNRYWDPKGDRLYLWAEQGAVTFRNLRIRPLE